MVSVHLCCHRAGLRCCWGVRHLWFIRYAEDLQTKTRADRWSSSTGTGDLIREFLKARPGFSDVSLVAGFTALNGARSCLFFLKWVAVKHLVFLALNDLNVAGWISGGGLEMCSLTIRN